MDNEVKIETLDEQKPNKKKGKGSVVVIVILVLIILGLVGYIAYDKGWGFSTKTDKETTEKGTENKDTKKDDNKGTEKTESKSKLVGIDLNKNLSDTKISVGDLSFDSNDGLYISLDNTQKKVNYDFNCNRVNTRYGLGWVTSNEDYSSEKHEINFDKKVVEVFIGSFGHAAQGDVVLFLMEDGTVEYIPVVDSFKNHRDNPVSYGKIENVKDVVRFVRVNACPTGERTSCYADTLAVTSDGSFYDLNAHIKENK